jgi:small conductance mechanosensitive channel
MNVKGMLEQTSDQWVQAIVAFIPKLALAVIVVVTFLLLAKLIRAISHRFYLRILWRQDHLARLVSILFYVLMLSAGVFLALEVLGLESVLAKLLAGAGVIGIIIGFAVKDITANSFAGLLLNTEAPFAVGDWVEISGTFGTVEKIGPITTSIRVMSGQRVFIPNQSIYSGPFTNFSSYGKRRVVLKSGISYGDNLTKVRAVTLEEIGKIDAVLRDEKIDFYFTDIGSSTFNFEVRFWIRFEQETDYLHAMNEAIVRIHDRFDAESISLAYNVTTLDFGVKGGVNLFDKELKVATKQ